MGIMVLTENLPDLAKVDLIMSASVSLSFIATFAVFERILDMMNALTPTASQYIPPSKHKVFDLSCDEPAQVKQAFVEQGYVVVQNISFRQDRKRIANILERYVKESPPIGPSYGYFMCRFRENPNMNQLFATLLDGGTVYVALDHCMDIHPEKAGANTLLLHVDQNPHQHLGLESVESLLALPGHDTARAVLGVLPGSHLDFADCRRWHSEDQFLFSLPPALATDASLEKLRAVHLVEGEIVVWDPRLTHSRLMNNGKCPNQATTMPMNVRRINFPIIRQTDTD